MEQAKNKMAEIIEIESAIEHKENLEAGESCSPFCPHCNSDNVYGMSRVVGYLSIIEKLNKYKK